MGGWPLTSQTRWGGRGATRGVSLQLARSIASVAGDPLLRNRWVHQQIRTGNLRIPQRFVLTTEARGGDKSETDTFPTLIYLHSSLPHVARPRLSAGRQSLKASLTIYYNKHNHMKGYIYRYSLNCRTTIHNCYLGYQARCISWPEMCSTSAAGGRGSEPRSRSSMIYIRL